MLIVLGKKISQSNYRNPEKQIGLKANFDDGIPQRICFLMVSVHTFVGMEILNKAINKLTSKGGTWRTILIEVSVSNIRITDCAV